MPASGTVVYSPPFQSESDSMASMTILRTMRLRQAMATGRLAGGGDVEQERGGDVYIFINISSSIEIIWYINWYIV